MTKSSAHKNNHRLYKDLEDIKHSLSRVSQDLKIGANDLFHDSLARTQEKSLEMQEDISDYISRKPLKSLSLALLTGAIIGYFVHRQ